MTNTFLMCKLWVRKWIVCCRKHESFTMDLWWTIHTHIHNRLMALCLGLPGWAGTRRDIHPLMWGAYWIIHAIFWVLSCKWKITEADTPTIWLDASPSGLSVPQPPSFQTFLHRMPFLPQPSQFILVWDRHQPPCISGGLLCGELQSYTIWWKFM